MYDPKYQEYFNTVLPSKIRDGIQYLRDHLPRKASRRNYQLSPKLLGLDRQLKKLPLQQGLQQVADEMCIHLHITKPIKVLTVGHIDGGRFEMNAGLNTIFINDNLKYQTFAQKVAILAHEVSHYYLMFQHNIRIPDEKANELLTEINAVYVGFGLILLKGYQVYETRTGRYIRKSKVGYISEKIVFEILMQTTYARRQQPFWVWRNLPLEYKLSGLQRLWPLMRAYLKQKWEKRKSKSKNQINI